MTLRVPCPRCGVESVADESKPLPPQFPFCSERCRLIDLGKWAAGEYRIAGKPTKPEPDAPADE